VLEKGTKLLWEVKTNSGLRGKAHDYSWFDSRYNETERGIESGGRCVDSAHCDTEKYVYQVNEAKLCGKTNWRLPTVKELQTLVDMDFFNPTIDKKFFPNTLSSGYWTSQPSTDVSFGDDFTYHNDKNKVRQIRLVHDWEEI
jgi:hypothetical protein